MRLGVHIANLNDGSTIWAEVQSFSWNRWRHSYGPWCLCRWWWSCAWDGESHVLDSALFFLRYEWTALLRWRWISLFFWSSEASCRLQSQEVWLRSFVWQFTKGQSRRLAARTPWILHLFYPFASWKTQSSHIFGLVLDFLASPWLQNLTLFDYY